MTLVLLYLQVFRLLRWLRILAYIGAIITGILYVTLPIVYVALCAPRNGQSTIAYFVALESHRCSHGYYPMLVPLGFINLFSDLYLLILPLPAVCKLQLPLRRKLAVSTMFLPGVMYVTATFNGSIADDDSACIASIVALYYRLLQNGNEENSTWLFGPLEVATYVIHIAIHCCIDKYYSTAELTAGIVVCSLPSAAQVFKQVRTLVPSMKPYYQRALRSVSQASATTHHQLSSMSSLHQRTGQPMSKTKATAAARPESPARKPKLDYDWNAFDGKENTIRKTTDIQIMNTSEG